MTTLKALTGRTSPREKQISAHNRVIKRFENDYDGLLKLQKLWSNSPDEHSEELTTIYKALTTLNSRMWSGELPTRDEEQDALLTIEAVAVAKAARRLMLEK